MKKNLNLMLIAMLCLFLAVPVFAGNATIDASINSTDVYEINNMTPGSSKTFLGTRLRGMLQQESTTSAACTTSYSGCNTVATSPTVAAYIKTTGTLWGESWALGTGYVNQRVTFVLATDGGRDFYVTPTTKTGFTNVQLNDAKDSVTLKYINATVGWIVDGNNGATVN